MKPSWNAALEAFDREYAVLQALLEEYNTFLHELFKLAAAHLRTRTNDRVRLELTQDETGTWYASWHPPGELAVAGLDVRCWPSSPYGGEPGRIRVGLYLSQKLDPVLPPIEDVRAAADEAIAGTPSASLMAPPADVLEAGAATCLGYNTLSLSDPEVADHLAEALATWCEAALHAAQAVVALSELPLWLAGIQDQLKASNALKTDEVANVSSGNWSVGKYLQVNLRSGPKLCFSVAPNGRLAVHWQTTNTDVSESAIRTAFGNLPDWRHGQWAGGVLLTAPAVQDLHESGSDEAAKDVVRETFKRFTRLVRPSP